MNFRDLVASGGLDEDCQASIFVEEVRRYRNELVHLSAGWKAHPAWQAVSDEKRDLAVFESLWRGIAEEGIAKSRDWAFVEKHFSSFDSETQHRVRSLLRDLPNLSDAIRRDVLGHLKSLDVFPTQISEAVAIDLVARARSYAAKRMIEGTDFDRLAEEAALGLTRPRPPQAPSSGVVEAGLVVVAGGDQGGSPQGTLAISADQQDLMRKTPAEMAEVFIADVFVINKHRTGQKRRQRKVGDPTERDVRWAMKLLEMAVEPGKPLSAVTSEDIRVLDSWFDHLPVTIGKSPRHRDGSMTLADIAEEAADRVENGSMDAADIGLTAATTNKHFRNIKRVHEHLRATLEHLPPLKVDRYITPDTEDQRQARDQMPIEIAKAIFSLPPWTGCAGLEERLAPGSMLFHDALFFVLPLVWYTGARREEICKLRIKDVILTPIPHIYVRASETGRIKTSNSQRKVPLHSELLRLGLLQYVDAMRAAGETTLFPELYPQAGTKRSLGDVFYKLWWIYIRPLVPGIKRGQAFHSVRHTIGDSLKQVGYKLEARNDFLGHSQTALGEGASRYAEAYHLSKLSEMAEAIPVVTAHLPAITTVNLLPKSMRVGRPSRKLKPPR